MPSKEAHASRRMALVSKLRLGLACGAIGVGLLTSAAPAQTTPREKLPASPLRPSAGGSNANNPAATRPLAKAAAKDKADAINLKELKVMAVVNTEQITATQLGHECMRRYGEEVLDSLVNRQLIA